jgi:N6-adenosine-specific RNA methylase IME4
MGETETRQRESRYRTIVADPPWPYEVQPGPGARKKGETSFLPYETMSLEAIKALPVREMSNNVDADAHLYLWTTDLFLEASFSVARAWGFHHSATIVWCKQQMGEGLGGIWPANVEFCLFCRRPGVTSRPDVLKLTTYLADAAERAGVTRRQVDEAMGTSDMAGWWLSRIETRCACPTDEQWARLRVLLGLGDEMDALVTTLNARKGTAPVKTLPRAPGRWFQWPRGAHSAKPEAFLDIVEQVSPAPHVELFARRARFGWAYWGNQSLGTAELPEVA